MPMVSVAPDPTEAFLKPMDVEGVLAILAALTDPKACATRLEALMAAQSAAQDAMQRAKELSDKAAADHAEAVRAKAQAEEMLGPAQEQALAAKNKAAAILADYQDRLTKLRLAEANHNEKVAKETFDLQSKEGELKQLAEYLEKERDGLIADRNAVSDMKAELEGKLATIRSVAA